VWIRPTGLQQTRVLERYQRDLTDEAWASIGGFLPLACPSGRPRAWPAREIINAIFYVLLGGIVWRLLPTDLPL
jgi:transposase